MLRSAIAAIACVLIVGCASSSPRDEGTADGGSPTSDVADGAASQDAAAPARDSAAAAQDAASPPGGAAISQQAYVKASNPQGDNEFGNAVALSSDGSTLAVGCHFESSSATGIDGDQSDSKASSAGAVYVFTRSGATWKQQAYIKPSNTQSDGNFAEAVALSADGNTLAVGASGEASNATGIDGNQSNRSAASAGAVYVFARTGTTWSQQAYVKPSNTRAGQQFGGKLALSGDGNTLGVGAWMEASNAKGINGNGNDASATEAGAVYVFSRAGTSWAQQAYLKPSNTQAKMAFGYAMGMTGDGNTIVVGAPGEGSNATGVNGNQTDTSVANAGAVYVFSRSGTAWTQDAYVKASNTPSQPGAAFGGAVAISSDGSTLAAGSEGDSSGATGINGNQTDTSQQNAGAVFVFSRAGTSWSQQAYVKASNARADALFGWAVTFSGNGNLLAVGDEAETSAARGINGNQSDTSLGTAGAVYLYERVGTKWTQPGYIKASNTQRVDPAFPDGAMFGYSVSLSPDGTTLVAGAPQESSNASGINGNQNDQSEPTAGAVYVFSLTP